jgi:hypothetical protein
VTVFRPSFVNVGNRSRTVEAYAAYYSRETALREFKLTSSCQTVEMVHVVKLTYESGSDMPGLAGDA